MVAGYCSWCRVESCGVSPFTEGRLISAAGRQTEGPCTQRGVGHKVQQGERAKLSHVNQRWKVTEYIYSSILLGTCTLHKYFHVLFRFLLHTRVLVPSN